MKLITMPRLAVLAVAGASLSLAACNNKADDATEATANLGLPNQLRLLRREVRRHLRRIPGTVPR